MALLIDASVLIALERGGAAPAALLEALGDRPVLLAAITASELLHGVHRADGAVRRERRERFVEAILGALPILPFDLDAARVHARLWADLRSRGLDIGAHDLLLAATALSRGFTIVTRDRRDFGKVEGLDLQSW